MCHLTRRLRHALVVSCAIVLGLPSVSFAFRQGADPIFQQFAEGHGVVIASALHVRPVWRQANKVWLHGITFRVAEVVAELVIGPLFPWKQGDTFEITTWVGYAGPFESRSDRFPAPGEAGPVEGEPKYVLVVRRGEVPGTWEHASGADAALLVETLAPDDLAGIRAARAVAALPENERHTRLRALVGDANAPAYVRRHAILTLRQRVDREETPVRERQNICESFTAAWNHLDNAGLSDHLLFVLDRGMRDCHGPSFQKSPERRRVWVRRLFAPFPDAAPEQHWQAVKERSDLLYHLVDTDDTGFRDGGNLLMLHLRNDSWPDDFRYAMARTLLQQWQTNEQPDPRWAVALNEFYPAALDAAADPVAVSTLTHHLWVGLHASSFPNSKRALRPGAEVLAALRRAKQRLLDPANPANANPHVGSYVRSIDRVLEAVIQPRPVVE